MAEGEKSGIYVRVNESFKKIQKIVKEIKAKRYSINVFGFSRGSFYARVFCAWLKENKASEEFNSFSPGFLGTGDIGYKSYSPPPVREEHTHNLRYDFLDTPPDLFNITLLGIYDTVSSHGLEHYDDPEGSDITSPLSLADGDTFPIAITNDDQEIEKIVHLTAQNEYREHFPLTHINAALESEPQKGRSAFEISFPGAHSNLGGAYTDVWEEEDHYLSLADNEATKGKLDGSIHWTFWKDKGYYSDSELSLSVKYHLKPGKFIDVEESRVPYHYYEANRGVRNHYQYITFGAMRMAAEKFGIMKFNKSEERLQERLNIFEQAKEGNDLNKSEAVKYQKEITEERAKVLREMDSAIRGEMDQHMDKHGQFKFQLSEYLSDIDEQKCFYGTFICNSLQPIYRLAAAGLGTVNEFEPITQEHVPIDKYDIRPEKKNVKKIKIGKESIEFKGIENEGSSKKNHRLGIPTRPTVEGG